MKNYVIINGVSSQTITGLMINELPPITKPEMRTQVEEIDGRDGDIITKLGYSAYDKTITIGLFGSGYDVNSIISFFNSEGTIVFSNEPDKYYNFTMLSEFDIERLQIFKTASITFHCQPFKYPTIETQKIIQPTILTSDGESITINNTASDYLKLSLKGNTSQASTPTPTSPIPVSVVSGDNEVVVCGKNIFDITQYPILQKVAYNGSGTKVTWASYVGIEEYIPIISNTAYTITSSLNANLDRVVYYDSSKNILSNTANVSTFTTPNNAKYIRFCYYTSSETIPTWVQLEAGSTATPYEPHQSQTYEVDLPVENLFDGVFEEGGWDISNGQKQVVAGRNRCTDLIPVQPSTAYTMSFENAGSVYLLEYGSSQNYLTYSQILYRTYSGTFTTSANTKYITFYYIPYNHSFTLNEKCQLELGTKVNSYTPYGTPPIELCKIGNYQDRIYKDNGKWYIEKQIGKVVLDGTNISATKRVGIANSKYGFAFNYDNAYRNGAYENGVIVCDRLLNEYRDNVYNNTQGIAIAGTNDYYGTGCFVYIADTGTMSVNDFNTWLTTHNLTVYYRLASPTTTLIEDNNLIGQLDNLSNATSYQGTTNVGQTNNDKPFIISASAVQSGTNEITINNIGNIYSKPLIALEGNGNVDIYLDDTQILKANVESKMNIDINTLEAYNPDTSALLNRQVIGNYNSMTFQPGNNKLTLNGSLSKATITNYTRWL